MSIDIVEVAGYQWQCSDCNDSGHIEVSPEFSQESAQEHRCSPTSSTTTTGEQPNG
jgi:hypothetical protein